VIGALVVEEGGPLCHAAIVAREFGLPAVIGAQAATTRIPHGAQVEVDPRTGTVRVL
jgi:pyruvate,water dikinase